MKRLFCSLIITLLLPSFAYAQDPRTAQDELISLVGEAIVQETTQASEEVRKAKEVLDVILRNGTQAEQEQARDRVEEAETRYRRSQEKLDTARLDAFARECGTSRAQIQSMRDSGMGWGRIAKECGIHPSVAGKGKGKAKGKNKNKNKNKGKGKNK